MLHLWKSLYLHSTVSKINAMGLLLVRGKENNPILVAQMKVMLHLWNMSENRQETVEGGSHQKGSFSFAVSSAL